MNTARHHTSYLNFTYRYQFCKKCEQVQPPRTYHCNKCNECVLRLDHHCRWLGTCIGLLNAKYYWQFLLYATISMLILTMGVFTFSGLTILSALGTILSLDFAILLIWQTQLIMGNKTTVDRFALS